MTKTSKVSPKNPVVSKSSSFKTKPTAQELYEIIAQTAYFKAEHRKFMPGYEESDWLEAEKEIKTLYQQ